MKQLKTLLFASIVTLFTTFANAVPVNMAPIISYLLSDNETSALNTLSGKTLYTTIYDITGTLESWTFNADLTSATWVEIVGGTGSETGTLSVDGMTMVFTDSDGSATIVVTEILTDYLLITIDGGVEQRLYFDEAKAREYFLGSTVIDYVTLLGGKTFYAVEADTVDGVERVDINDDVTLLTYYGDPEPDTLLIDGEKIIVTPNVADENGYEVFLLLAEETSDYLLFNIFLPDGTPVGSVRLYFDQATAEAYYETLGGGESILITDLVSGHVTFKDANNSNISVPSDAWVRIVPSIYQQSNSYDGPRCKIDSSGNFGQECYIDGNEQDIRNAINDSSETFQVLVFKNHILPNENDWDCGENLYRYVGSSLSPGSWSDILVLPSDFQDRSNDVCD